MQMKSLWASVQENPVVFRKINGWLTVLWFIAAFPICIFLANSVPFLVFISVYAVVTGHLSTWQASRVEVRQEQEKDERDSKDEADLVKVEKKVDDLHDHVKK
jgi:hypothetical protein